MKAKMNFRRLFSILIIIDSCTKLTAREHLIRGQFKCNHWVAAPGTTSLIKKGSGASGTSTLRSGKTADDSHITSASTDGATTLQRWNSSAYSGMTTPVKKYNTFTYQKEATNQTVTEGGTSFGVSNSASEGATTNNDGTSTVGINCMYTSGSNTEVLENGSSILDADCSSIMACINGEIHVQKNYNCGPNAACEVRDGRRECFCIEGFYRDGETCSNHTNCLDIFNAGNNENGVYKVKPSNWDGPPFDVYCNMSEGGGWTVFQRRVDGSVDFNRTWDSYKEGFGVLEREFWLGNDKLHYLTNQGNYRLGIDMVKEHGASFYAHYNLFRINDESDSYKLSVLGTYSGTAGYDALGGHLKASFSTHDSDNDDCDMDNCADQHHGAWWYTDCGSSNLNGNYHGCSNSQLNAYWTGPTGGHRCIKYTEMKIRPRI